MCKVFYKIVKVGFPALNSTHYCYWRERERGGNLCIEQKLTHNINVLLHSIFFLFLNINKWR